MSSVTLNGRTYTDADFSTAADPYAYARNFPFPFSLDLITEITNQFASVAAVQGVAAGAAGGYLRSTGAAWARVSGIAASDLTTGAVKANVGFTNAGSSAFSPGFPVHVYRDDNAASQAAIGAIETRSDTAFPQFWMRRSRANGTNPATLTAVASGDSIAGIFVQGYDGTGYSNSAGMQATAAETFTASAHGTALQFATTAIGSIVQTNRWQIQAAGHLVGVADNSYDVGQAGASRPRTGYFATSVVIGADPGGPALIRLSDGTTQSANDLSTANQLGLNLTIGSSASSGPNIAAHFAAKQSVATTGSIQGIEGYTWATHTSGTVALAVATIGNIEINGTGGTTTWARSVGGGGLVVAGTVTNWASLYASKPGITGVITNLYGVFAEDMGAGAWGIKTGTGWAQFGGAVITLRSTVTYSTSMTIDARLANDAEITATNATAFTINAPTNPVDGQRLTVTVRNTSGGALGVATWNAVFKMTAWTQPATAFSRSITFRYNGTNWVEIARTAADVPN